MSLGDFITLINYPFRTVRAQIHENQEQSQSRQWAI